MHEPVTVPVRLGQRSYDILVGEGLLARAAEWIVPQLQSKRAIILTDQNVAAYYVAPLKAALMAKDINVDTLIVEPGEASKSFTMLESVCEELLALTPDRKTTLIALGGGVVGDLTGFVASILLRGVPFIQIPTSLLAQVDSSVGGKTAINTRAGKNLIGSFYQPNLVLADLDTLHTLPTRERLAGYAEILKYGLIMRASFYDWCLENAAALLEGNAAALQYAVAECCRMKAEIVAADEREAAARALLNFGHTFGHALEAETGMSSKLLHGEAVAMGMVMACRLSARLGLLAETVEYQLADHLRAVGLPAYLADIDHPWDAAAIAAHFSSDKKAEQGALTFIVLDAVGSASIARNIDPFLAQTVVESYLAEKKE